MFKYFGLPDIFSCAALIAAMGSISLSISGQPGWALALLPLAALFDGLDGFTARTRHRVGRFGVELDSLVDMVAYGVTLSVFWLMNGPRGFIDIVAVTVLPLALAIRLANFNIKAPHEPYLGMPSGWNAWLMPLAYLLGLSVFFPLLFLLAAALMLSPVPIPKLSYQMEDGKLAIGFTRS